MEQLGLSFTSVTHRLIVTMAKGELLMEQSTNQSYFNDDNQNHKT